MNTVVSASLAVLLFCSLALPQEGRAQTNSSRLAAVSLQEGFPGEIGVKKKFAAHVDSFIRSRVSKPRHAAILSAEAPRRLFAVVGKAKGADRLSTWLLHRRPDSSFTMQSVSFRGTVDGTLADTLELNFDQEGRKVATLELRVLPEQNFLLYRWSRSDASVSAGSRPVIKTRDEALAVGKQMPSLTVETLDGKKISLADLRGKNVVLNWWNIACAPCIAEMPGLNKLVEKYGDHEDIVFLAVARNSARQVEAFLEQRDFAYRQALSNERAVEVFGRAYPRNVIIDARGTVVYDHTGAREGFYKEVERAMKKHIL